MELYSQILDHGGPAFGTILRHIRDHPEKACVFHCTGNCLAYYIVASAIDRRLTSLSAGKDRTGVIAALLLKVHLSPATPELS